MDHHLPPIPAAIAPAHVAHPLVHPRPDLNRLPASVAALFPRVVDPNRQR